LHRRIGADTKEYALVGSGFERPGDIIVAGEILAVDGQEIIAGRNVDSRLS